MSNSVTAAATSPNQADPTTHTHGWWRGGVSPFNVSYGKLMMWIFLLSDTFTFCALLVSYGSTRFSEHYWPDPNVAFDKFFFLHANMPLLSSFRERMRKAEQHVRKGGTIDISDTPS